MHFTKRANLWNIKVSLQEKNMCDFVCLSPLIDAFLLFIYNLYIYISVSQKPSEQNHFKWHLQVWNQQGCGDTKTFSS